MSRARVRAGTADWPVPLHILEGDADKFAGFDAADVALAASGTVTTELALARTPMVMAYRLGWLTWTLMRPLVHARFGTLVNILLDREAVPELVQTACKPQALADAVEALLRDETVRAAQLRDLDDATKKLGEGGEPPSLRAARALLAFVREARTKA